MSTKGPLPEGAAAVLLPLPGGACPAFDRAGGNRCAVQIRLGHGGLPASCRHFPRVALLEADAVRVTLSHFCPTAAWMLFTPAPERLAIVREAVGIADRLDHEGFDARRTVPPFLRPGVAMDAGTCRVWERCVIGALDCDGLSAEAALAAAARAAEAIRRWTAGTTSLENHAARAAAAARDAAEPPARWAMPLREALRLHSAAAALVPAELGRPVVPAGLAQADLAWVLPRWPAHARPVRRYLAARAFAAWSAYLGEGIRTQVALLAVALAAVRVEAAREAALAPRPLDDEMLHAAIRSADLLLHHLSDAAALVGRFADVEQGPAPAFPRAIGLEATR